MTTTDATLFRPEIGRVLPASIIRLIVAVILVALSVGIIGFQLLLALAALLILAALVFPRTPAAWILAGLLGLCSLGAIGAEPTWKFFAALAAAHFLHVIGMTLFWLPLGGPVQLRVLGRILRRYLIIQIPAQLVGYAVLTALAGKPVVAELTSPAFGIAAAVGFVVMIVLIITPAVRGRGKA